jgi:transposase
MTVTRTLPGSVSEPSLYVAFELGATQWKLGMTSGWGTAPWVRTVAAGNWPAIRRVFAQARQRFGLPASAGVVSCYEAGRDGFWIHRALAAQGISNRIVDSASIEVNRRARRAKTDRLDARKLAQMLVRACLGEPNVWREVRVPAAAVEAARHVSRERMQLTQDRTRLVNQVRGWLTTWGARLPARRAGQWWTTVCAWTEEPLPAEVQARIARAQERLTMIETQLRALSARQREAAAAAPAASALGRLVQLKGIAASGASVLLEEGLVWRAFRNRREVGGMLGFAPLPYQSGDQARDQGIARAGNTRWRAISTQLAWNWVRWQPTSALTRWYQQSFGGRGARARRIGIIAVARKLVIALWRYATTGERPTGAIVKVA